ncbi:hypothetical protein ABBQ32_012512 [Trebouxia sp. C0010 RCD-2024]
MRRAAWRAARTLHGSTKGQGCSLSSDFALPRDWTSEFSAVTCRNTLASVLPTHPSFSGGSLYHSTSRCFSQAPVASYSSGKGRSSSRSSAAFVFALPCLFTAFLGTWQVQRRQWKVDLLQARTAALKAEGAELSELPPQPAEFTRVHVQGQFDHDASLYVGPRPRSSMGSATNGYQIITPLHSSQWEKPVLVNRGWVPATWRSDPKFRRHWESKDGRTSLQAVTRVSEDPSAFVPQNNPKTGEWFWIDVPAMAASLDLPSDTPLVEVVSVEERQPTSSGPTAMDVLGLRTNRPLNMEEYPITRSVSELMRFKVTPEDHRNYALTWYTLSAATGAMAFGILRKRRSR